LLFEDQEGSPLASTSLARSALGTIPIPGVIVYHLDDLTTTDMLAEGGEFY